MQDSRGITLAINCDKKILRTCTLGQWQCGGIIVFTENLDVVCPGGDCVTVARCRFDQACQAVLPGLCWTMWVIFRDALDQGKKGNRKEKTK